jgi:parallel beta-helix repeat protein
MFILLLTAAFMLTALQFVQLANANVIPVPERLPVNQAYFRSDGSIDPPTLPIERSGNTYALKESILNCSITIERDNIVIDGASFSMSIPSYGEKGADGQVKSAPALIQIINRTHITVKNFVFHNAAESITVWNSSYVIIEKNRITNCNWIYLRLCTHCSILSNIMENNNHGLYGYDNNHIEIKYNKISGSNWHGIILESLTNSNIIGNVFDGNNGQAICYLGLDNRVIGNVFQNNEGGILSYVENNEIHHNNFINNYNDNHYNDISINAPNVLDDGKEGNYWSSNHNNQPFVIASVFVRDNESNVDHFPRTIPYIFDYQSPVVSIFSPENKTYSNGDLAINFSASEEISRTSYNLDGNEGIELQQDTVLTGLSEGTHHLTVYVEDAFGNVGASQTIAFTVAKPELPASFTVVPVVAIAVVAVIVAAGLLVYFKKRKPRAANSDSFSHVNQASQV